MEGWLGPMVQTDTYDQNTIRWKDEDCQDRGHRLTISRNGKSRTFVIRPALMASVVAVGALFSVSYIASTAYLFFRDDLQSISSAHTDEIENDYEVRIARLRAEVDRLTSRQIVERHSVEDMLKAVLERQKQLHSAQSQVSNILQRAAASGLSIALNNPLPLDKPDFDASTRDGSTTANNGHSDTDVLPTMSLRGAAMPADAAPAKADGPHLHDLSRVSASLDRMTSESAVALDTVAVTAEKNINAITKATRALGYNLADLADDSDDDVGGPFVPLPETNHNLELRLVRADKALTLLQETKDAARELPLGQPVADHGVSSHFGPRLDPFMHVLTMHTGIDLRAPFGSPVHAAAAGTVTVARYNGGYGNMVEIAHKNGLTTRYGHLSKINVQEGETVNAGEIIGQIGSTGRSTGPHLHYEVRKSDEPIDPAAYLSAGHKLASILAD